MSNLYMVGSQIIGVGSGICATGATGGGFTPQSGFTFSGTVADGQTFTITSNSAVLGSKPVNPIPLLWIDPATSGNINPSPLGRTTTTYFPSNLSYASTGGPLGTGWAQGAAVVSGDTGTTKKWTTACDIDQWGAGSPNINDSGAKYYLSRQVYRNFGHYDENTSTYNIKNHRCWGRTGGVGGTDNYPDFYMSTSNQRLTCELTPPSGGYPFTPVPDFTRPGQGAGTPDQIAENNVIQFDAGLPGTPNSVTFQNWFNEEIVYQSNTTDPGSTTPPQPDNGSMSFQWFVEGLLSNQSAFPTPVDTYQWNQLYSWGSGQGIGTMLRWYFWHYIVDGTGGRPMIPVGSFIGYGPTLLDDSWCRVHIRNNSSRSSFTVTEPQPTSSWITSPTNSVSVTLRKGRLSSYSGNSLIITDSSGTEHFVGTFT
jgi:hypothetical protein